MPEWITPLLWPGWGGRTPGSFSSTQRYAFGLRSRIASAVASPTIPPPTTATSNESSTPRILSPGGHSHRLRRGVARSVHGRRLERVRGTGLLGDAPGARVRRPGVGALEGAVHAEVDPGHSPIVGSVGGG